MKKILLTILGIIIVAIAAFVIVVQMQPDTFRYSRSITINAPPAAVFPQVNNLHNWEAWSPWAKLDPNAKMTFTGPQEGVNAAYAWEGNSQVGAGTMTVTESKPNEQVGFRLDFLKPFKGTSNAEFTFKPEGSQTVVTWTMFGPCNFLSKAMGLVMNCEKMMGEEFDKGLTQMKAVVEGGKK